MLVALAGVGVHLAVRPHNSAVAPPPVVLPIPPPSPLAIAPSLPAAAPAPAPARGSPTPVPTPNRPPLSGAWLAELGREDRRQAAAQWEVLRRLIKAIERYLGERVIPDLDRGR